MRPLVRPHTDAAGGQWFAVTAIFSTEALSSAAYQHVLAALPRGDLGFYRHGLPEVGGTCTSGVSVKRTEVLRLARLLAARGGEDVELAWGQVEAMCVRRARIVTGASEGDLATGRLKIRHAGRGARLYPDGTMRETGGGYG